MTQSMFDEKVLERFLDKASGFGLPILVGILPLHNSRHAELLHSQVPGMMIPEAVRERMRRAGDNGPREGQAYARDFIGLCRSRAAGIYLVPSFGRYELIAELIAEAKG